MGGRKWSGFRMRLGILGGTFDPIHLGHLLLAEECREILALDKVLFVPAGQPWLKAGQPLTAAIHRLRMVELATAANPHFEVLRWEVERPGPSYTGDTLERLRAETGAAAELHFILGLDALADFPLWKDPERILQLANLAVVPRPGYSQDGDDIVAGIKSRYPAYADRITMLGLESVAISATELRRRAARGQSIHYRVPAAVGEYIGEQGLYKGG